MSFLHLHRMTYLSFVDFSVQSWMYYQPMLSNQSGLIVPYVTVLLNLSFSQGVFPSRLKLSLTKPILKNSIMDFNSRKSYRPVSNLTFISKLIETAAKTELLAHFSKYDLLHSNQSAYRPGHGVETTLLDVYSSILSALDSEKCCFLVLLDLSAAFDTISHSQLLSILESSFGITRPHTCNIPAYLKTNFKIKNNVNVRFTRSQLGPTCVPPNSKLKTIGDRSYRVGIPKLWNELPLNLRCVESLNLFKKQLKTHIFKFHFT